MENKFLKYRKEIYESHSECIFRKDFLTRSNEILVRASQEKEDSMTPKELEKLIKYCDKLLSSYK